MKTENSRCLVLNADYTALTIVDWKKALIWSIKYDNDASTRGVEIIDFYKNDYIMGVNGKKFPLPAVIKTKRYYRLSNHKVNFSRKNLFIRDNHSCQYCGMQKDLSQLTYDHVIPKSLWKHKYVASPTSWTNIVTACIECNRKKGNKTPAQANMPLQNLPVAPTKSPKYLPITHFLGKIREDIPEEWSVYLPQSYSK